VIEEHRRRCVILRLDDAAEKARGGVRRRQSGVIVDGALAEVEVISNPGDRGTLPYELFKLHEVIEAWEERVYAVVLPAD
jgi:hypothetical protein